MNKLNLRSFSAKAHRIINRNYADKFAAGKFAAEISTDKMIDDINLSWDPEYDDEISDYFRPFKIYKYNNYQYQAVIVGHLVINLYFEPNSGMIDISVYENKSKFGECMVVSEDTEFDDFMSFLRKFN